MGLFLRFGNHFTRKGHLYELLPADRGALAQPGTFLLVLGAILVYTSGIVARKLFSGSEKADIITKIVGCVVALVGAILIFS